MRIFTTFLIVLITAAPALAQAQDVVASGAIHTLTGPRRDRSHHRRRHVHIPRYIHHHRHFGIALPPGTDRPGRTRTFIPAR